MVSELVGIWLDGGIKRQGRERVRDVDKWRRRTDQAQPSVVSLAGFVSCRAVILGISSAASQQNQVGSQCKTLRGSTMVVSALPSSCGRAGDSREALLPVIFPCSTKTYCWRCSVMYWQPGWCCAWLVKLVLMQSEYFLLLLLLLVLLLHIRSFPLVNHKKAITVKQVHELQWYWRRVLYDKNWSIQQLHQCILTDCPYILIQVVTLLSLIGDIFTNEPVCLFSGRTRVALGSTTEEQSCS